MLGTIIMAASTQFLYREPSGDVVMTDGRTTMRFMTEYGAAPEQWYAPGFPPIINEFPGAGVSVAFRSGQDPTQASSNGVMKAPIARLGDASSARWNYYGRETIFDPANRVYEARMFMPDFWASMEARDDAIASNPDGSATGWCTPYSRGEVAYIDAPTRPIVFRGRPGDTAGIIFVGDESSDPNGSHWAWRLRRYEGGRQALRVNISLEHAALPGSFAGALLRKDVPWNAANKDDAYRAPGIHVVVTKAGRLGVSRMSGGEEYFFGAWQLATEELSLLNGMRGLNLEMRTHNSIQGFLAIYANGRFVTSIVDETHLAGPHMGLIASPGETGSITFQERAPYDVGVEVVTRWESIPGRGIVSDVTIHNAPGVEQPHYFDRANMPAVFLNQLTFGNRIDGSGRTCAVINGTEAEPEIDVVDDGTYPLTNHLGFWCGNNDFTAGVFAIPEIATTDGQPATTGHVLLKRDAEANGEFVMMLNPLRENAVTEAREILLRTRWQTLVPQ